jgi:hypothetical protein
MRMTMGNCRNDPMFPRIERVVAGLLARGTLVSTVDVLMAMGLLARRTSRTEGTRQVLREALYGTCPRSHLTPKDFTQESQ